jgi:hypothetical protein
MNARVSAKRTAKLSARVRDGVRTAANGHCLTHYGDAYVGGTPHMLSLPAGPVWVVPVALTSAGYGSVGEVGVVAVDAKTWEVLDATPPDEVRAAGARLAREKQDVLDAAFRRARAT